MGQERWGDNYFCCFTKCIRCHVVKLPSEYAYSSALPARVTECLFTASQWRDSQLVEALRMSECPALSEAAVPAPTPCFPRAQGASKEREQEDWRSLRRRQECEAIFGAHALTGTVVISTGPALQYHEGGTQRTPTPAEELSAGTSHWSQTSPGK